MAAGHTVVSLKDRQMATLRGRRGKRQAQLGRVDGRAPDKPKGAKL
jgi:hypothetical protein